MLFPPVRIGIARPMRKKTVLFLFKRNKNRKARQDDEIRLPSMILND
jgi:hypothetical protein